MAHRGVFVFSPRISFVPLLPCSPPFPEPTSLATVLARARPGQWLLQPRCVAGPQCLPQRCYTGLRRSSPCGLCKSRLPPTLFPLDCNDGPPRSLDSDESRPLRLRERTRLGCWTLDLRTCLLGQSGCDFKEPKGILCPLQKTPPWNQVTKINIDIVSPLIRH